MYFIVYWNSPDMVFQVVPTLQEQWLITFSLMTHSNPLDELPRSVIHLSTFLWFRVKCGPEKYELQAEVMPNTVNEKIFRDLSTLPLERFVVVIASFLFDPIMNKHIFEIRIDGLLVLSSDQSEIEPVIRNDVSVKGGSMHGNIKNIMIKSL